jgi:hypothetical protein
VIASQAQLLLGFCVAGTLFAAGHIQCRKSLAVMIAVVSADGVYSPSTLAVCLRGWHPAGMHMHMVTDTANHHHHHVTQSSHSINAIGPAPLWSGRKREHCSIMFATITHIPTDTANAIPG